PDAKKGLAEAYKKAPDRLAKEFAKDAKKSYDAGKLDDANDDLDSAAALDPKLIDVPLIRAQILLDKQDGKGAEKEARRALSMDKENRDARFILASIAFIKKDWKRAETEFRKLRTEDPKAFKFHNMLGWCYYRQKEYRKAEREWKEALKCSKPDPTK